MEEISGPICGIENCRDYHYREGGDGYLYCRNGHRSTHEQVATAEENAALPIFGRRVRRRDEDVEATVTTIKTLEGVQAYELYLACYQLILRKQARWLVRERGYPVQLETVIRDLWALRLSSITRRIETAPKIFSSQFESDASESEMETLATKKRTFNKYLSVTDTISLCYFAMLLLRLPVSVGEIYEWICSQEMLYLNAPQAIPYAMKQKLPSGLRKALNKKSVPDKTMLHTHMARFARDFQSSFNFQLPPLNHTLLLFRYLTELALPLEVFPAVNRLAALLSKDFKYPANANGPYLIMSDLPEPSLAALLVVTVKLLLPFDSYKRYPRAATEPSAQAVDWKAWKIATTMYKDRSQDEANKTAVHAILETTEANVLKMTGKEIDKYLDWYERTWVDDQIDERPATANFRKALFKMFPTGSSIIASPQSPEATDPEPGNLSESNEQPQLNTLKRVQAASITVKVVSNAEGANAELLRPGSHYKHYRSEADMPEKAKVFYNTVANLAGISLKGLMDAVFQTEMRVKKWVEAENKKDMTNSNY